jgi:hypothetical protein
MYKVWICCLTLLLLMLAKDGNARIVRIEVKALAPDSTRGVPSSYQVIQGLAYGEVDPRDPHNSIIQDIGLADKNTHGMVEYVTTFTLYAPLQPSPKAVLLYDVVNRGGEVIPREYSNGDFYLVSGWQGDIPFGGKANNGTHGEMVRVPIAHYPNGSLVTGPVFARFIDQEAGKRTLDISKSITYGANDVPPTPLDLDTRHASLITKRYEDIDGAVSGLGEVAADDWAWGDCDQMPFPGKSDSQKICLKKGADPALLYELRYTAKDPLVLGIGLAATRDINAFFRSAAKDDCCFNNPVTGHVRAVIATGVSQSGNFLRSFVNLGFNEDESGHQVFDGIMPIVSARQTPLNVRFGVPGGTSMLYEFGTEGVNWWTHTSDTLRNHPDGGEMDRCTLTHTCPKVIEMLGSAEFYSLRASMTFVGTSANVDLPLPENVRRYYIASTTHGGGKGGFDREAHAFPENCVLPSNPMPETPTRRALLLALKQWVVDVISPPSSVYPTLRAGTLASSTVVLDSFPRIPGQPLPHDALNPNLIYETGSDFHDNDLSGVPTSEPPAVIGAAKAVLPALDLDGNEIGGIHSVLQQVPLGTYIGWNIVKAGFRKGQFCPLTGGYIPLTITAKEREMLKDPRPSIEERYRNHEDYVNRVRTAAAAMVKERFLLEEDAEAMVIQADASDVLR